MKGESPVINGDGNYSRDFTYIDNVIQANLLSLLQQRKSINTVYNVAYGDRNNLNDLMKVLKSIYLSLIQKFQILKLYTAQIEQVIFLIHTQV